MEIEEHIPDLNIEAVTFYRNAHAPSKSTDHNSGGRRIIPISLPRVKWLEIDGKPYMPEWATAATVVDEAAAADAPVAENPPVTPERKRMQSLKGSVSRSLEPLSPKERQALDLAKTGMSSRDIARHLHISMGAAKDRLYRARVKASAQGLEIA